MATQRAHSKANSDGDHRGSFREGVSAEMEIRTATMMVILMAMQTVTQREIQTEIRTAPMMVNPMHTQTVILKADEA
jgi:hypothetical protein